MTAKLEKANKELEDARLSKDDRERLKELEKVAAEQKDKLVEAERKVKDLSDAKSGALIERYQWTWYAAAAGWAAALLIGIALVANLAKGAP